jgi:ABC-type dipeptide/oligopeptide/nickel transport system permease subunit
MLSAGWQNFLNAPRIAILAGTAFFFAIFSFMMLGEGLRRYFADMYR